uniref:Uncharacterized protein n=1 Tax=Octopus bimaculoides TaxID=37653 RepID=A0A0L8FPG2_OCTBM
MHSNCIISGFFGTICLLSFLLTVLIYFHPHPPFNCYYFLLLVFRIFACTIFTSIFLILTFAGMEFFFSFFFFFSMRVIVVFTAGCPC